MAAAQATFEFPLISLPSNYQLLVFSTRHNETQEEQIKLLTLRPKKHSDQDKIRDFITIPKTSFIQEISSPKRALAKFHHIFNNETHSQYFNFSLQGKMAEAFDRCNQICLSHKKIIDLILWYARDHLIYLLNIKDFEEQFTKVRIPTATINKLRDESSIRSVHHASELLCKAIRTTDLAAYYFLKIAKTSPTLTLHWAINDLEIKYDIEKTTQKHAIRIFNEALYAPKQPVTVKEHITQILYDLNTVEKDKLNLGKRDQYHFIKQGFLPSFESQEEILSSTLKDRILTAHTGHVRQELLRKFQLALRENFSSIIDDRSSEEEDSDFLDD